MFKDRMISFKLIVVDVCQLIRERNYIPTPRIWEYHKTVAYLSWCVSFFQTIHI